MIWQIQQPQPWVTLLAWSVWMIHFVDLGHRNSWLRHLDSKKKCESSGSNKFQFVRTIWKLKTTESQLHYSESLHKIPMLGVVLKGACAHAPKWGMKRKLSTFSIMWSTTSFGKDEIASAHPKTLPFFPSNLQWPRCHYKVSMQVANVFFSQRMNQTHSVFNAQLHPKRSYQLDYGSWLSTKSQAGKR